MPNHNRHPVDTYIGRRIRERRGAAGMTQAALAARLKITQQQVSFIEAGTNRVSASRLFEIARALGVTDMNAFFPNHRNHRGGK